MNDAQQTFTASGGDAWLCRFAGEVLHADRVFETHVSSSGGGGSVGPNGGYVHAPQLNSETTDHQTVFVRAEDGTEQSFEWRNWNLPVRPGSKVAVIWGAKRGEGNGSFLAARNFDTGEERWKDVRLWARGQALLSGKMRGWPSLLIAILLAGMFAGVGAFSGGLIDPISVFLGTTVIAFVPILIVEWIIVIMFRAGDDEHKRIHELLAGYLRTGAVAE